MRAEQIAIEASVSNEPVAADPVAARDQGGVGSGGEPSSTCGEGNWADCFELGKSYRDGDGVPRDPARAVEFLGQACDGGHAEACSHLGYMYFKGEGVGVDMLRATELYRRACVGDKPVSCYTWDSCTPKAREWGRITRRRRSCLGVRAMAGTPWVAMTSESVTPAERE